MTTTAPRPSSYRLAATVLSPELLAEIDAAAKAEGMSRSAIIRRCILRDMKRSKKAEG